MNCYVCGQSGARHVGFFSLFEPNQNCHLIWNKDRWQSNLRPKIGFSQCGLQISSHISNFSLCALPSLMDRPTDCNFQIKVSELVIITVIKKSEIGHILRNVSL